MSDEMRNRIIREKNEQILTPPNDLLASIEDLGTDPRRPRTAIARYHSRKWLEAEQARMQYGDTLPLTSTVDKEAMERPSYYPEDFGIGFIPDPYEYTSEWAASTDYWETVCYTNLSAPKPFDPHLHGDLTAKTVGYGYHYHSTSPWTDLYDIVTRRGGGPRGGFSYTTGPTEGTYPSSILPQPTFNLGTLGFTNGGWNPEGLQWTNRPKRMRLHGLRNGWPHKVYFCRSRQVMFRNVYGTMATEDATPNAPLVLINGTSQLNGIRSIGSKENENSPVRLTIQVNNTFGRRSGIVKVGDTVQVFCAPRTWANPPLVFTGFVAELEETETNLTLYCDDNLGLLASEYLTTEPTLDKSDVANVIKAIIAGSSYSIPMQKITTETGLVIPQGMKFVGKSRLGAIQSCLKIIASSPKRASIRCDNQGFIELFLLTDLNDANISPYIGGRMPRTDVPQDLYPTSVEKTGGDVDFFNVATVYSSTNNIQVTVSGTGASVRPMQLYHVDDGIKTKEQGRIIAHALLSEQGESRQRWEVEALPERFDIRVGDVVEFASYVGGLSGRHRVRAIGWKYTTGDNPIMNLTLGSARPSLVATLQSVSSAK